MPIRRLRSRACARRALLPGNAEPQLGRPISDGTCFSIIAPTVEKLSRHIFADTPETPKQQ